MGKKLSYSVFTFIPSTTNTILEPVYCITILFEFVAILFHKYPAILEKAVLCDPILLVVIEVELSCLLHNHYNDLDTLNTNLSNTNSRLYRWSIWVSEIEPHRSKSYTIVLPKTFEEDYHYSANCNLVNVTDIEYWGNIKLSINKGKSYFDVIVHNDTDIIQNVSVDITMIANY